MLLLQLHKLETVLENGFFIKKVIASMLVDILRTFTWDPKWTQTALRFDFGVKFHFGVR